MFPTRFGVGSPARAEVGWALARLTPPRALYGAAGILFGPDGRLYVAQPNGSQLSAIDIASGAVDVVSPKGSELVAMDDLAFDSRGVAYLSETMYHRVTALHPDGTVRRIASGVIDVNGITCDNDRIFADECRVGGRVCEVFRDGSPPMVLAEGLAAPNALALGPDGYLYVPEVLAGQVSRVPVDGGAPEVVVSGIPVPVAVKFDGKGRLVVASGATGELIEFDVAARRGRTLATVRIGLDNLAFSPEGRLFVSWSVDGGISEVADGREIASVVPAGLMFPLGLAVTKDGRIFAADNIAVQEVSRAGAVATAASFFTPGFPGPVRGLALTSEERLVVTTTGGRVSCFDPVEGSNEVWADGLAEPTGIARLADGSMVVAETGAGRVLKVARGKVIELVDGLSRPTGVATGRGGSIYVAETAEGRVMRVGGPGRVEQVAGALAEPQGIAVLGDEIAVLEVGAGTLTMMPTSGFARRVIVRGLPLGSPPGVVAKPLPGLELMPGPLTQFADLAVGPDGEIVIGADGDGSLLRLEANG